ncbi:MAG: class III poly(R)-hydroxyalkanoic acid synthase subunit PhaC [Bacteroidota bacterium]|nr:class III poly(R)-hydroxyalkanoic acid synthase subunit PhaC [Bacteroidota bacterium]
MSENTEELKNPMDTWVDMLQKMAKGYENLSQIENVDVATAQKELVWQLDKVKMYHYKNDAEIKVKTPVLISYALVNRQDMMDIQPDRSYIRNLLNLGLDIYMMDWGYPTQADKFLTLDDYIEMYLNDGVDFIRKSESIDKINLMGICQGGTFSVIYAALHPEKIKNLITLVTPVDFSKNDGLLIRWSRDMNFDTIVDSQGTINGDFLNAGFSMLKPMMQAGKMMNLMNIIDDKDKLMNYLRMEKWINDSPNQAGECYRRFMKELYQENKLAENKLIIEGKLVDLKNLNMPLLNIYASEDHLVPPSASIALNDLVGSTDTELYKFPGGHIGVFVGGRSQKELAPAVESWLKSRDN